MDKDLPSPASTYLGDLLEVMPDLTDYQRTLVFSELRDKWCENCGGKHGPIMRCQCWNEE